jgi:hypothetical protein
MRKKSVPPAPEKVTFHYLKTGSYRTYHVDGIFGGITPNGKLYAEIFIQRATTPQTTEQEINLDGTLGNETDRTGKKGIVREIEAGLIMDMETARVLRNWIDSKIQEFEKMGGALVPSRESK